MKNFLSALLLLTTMSVFAQGEEKAASESKTEENMNVVNGEQEKQEEEEATFERGPYRDGQYQFFSEEERKAREEQEAAEQSGP